MPFANLLNADFVRENRNAEIRHLYDIELRRLELLSRYSSVECHVVVYPYSRLVSSADITLSPFEEYVRDIQSLQKSSYTPIVSNFNKLFGLFLGAVITAVFMHFKPDDLVSVESVVSILGAFLIGKELWDDIDRMLVNLTKRWPLRLMEGYYSYKLEKDTTLTHYSKFAKRHRYGKDTVLPDKIDFIEQSNSQTVRTCFSGRDLRGLEGPAVHLLSVAINPECVDEYQNRGSLFGVKVSLNRAILGVTFSTELFQSVDS
ncbi:MAG: hypothetical protein GF331_18390, partial [Chitinivibrionales bacterium]|nr:hypothetical protein [Chitinivibrionales bacterium]